MPNYQNGKIYKLVSDMTDKVYYGSTTQRLCNRKAKHICNYNLYKKGKYKYLTSFEIVKYDSCQIILCENYPCDSVEKLRAREREYIESNTCINKAIPNRTKKEYSKSISENRKVYMKEYKNNNKDSLSYRLQKSKCECGTIVSYQNKSAHKKSKKHLAFIAAKN